MFDLRTHKRNSKGHITHTDTYTLHIKDGTRLFERPKGSGIMYAENGDLVRTPKSAKDKADPILTETDKKSAQAVEAPEITAPESLDEALLKTVEEPKKPVVTKPTFVK